MVHVHIHFEIVLGITLNTSVSRDTVKDAIRCTYTLLHKLLDLMDRSTSSGCARNVRITRDIYIYFRDFCLTYKNTCHRGDRQTDRQTDRQIDR